jgi:hypothetical protein
MRRSGVSLRLVGNDAANVIAVSLMAESDQMNIVRLHRAKEIRSLATTVFLYRGQPGVEKSDPGNGS